MTEPSSYLNRDFGTFTKTFQEDISKLCLYDSITFSNENNATKATFVINKDRYQCYGCLQWFPTRAQIDHHFQWVPQGCEVHRVCFALDNNVEHARLYAHDRCFVERCRSKYRDAGGWPCQEVENHVRECHGRQPEPQLPAYTREAQ